MQYKRLGNTGVLVSELCLGTMTFGRESDEKTAAGILDAYLEQGGNVIDEANVYGASRGASEKVLGRLLGSRRDRVILTTKAFFAEEERQLNSGGLHRGHLIKSLEESLRRLQTDYVDLFFLHCEDMVTPLEETLSTLDGLVRQGKVRYVGVSNFPAWKTMKALGLCQSNGWAKLVCMQPQYNLLVRDIEREFVPLCRSENLGLLAWAPLAGGFLSGKYQREQANGGAAAGRLGVVQPVDVDSWQNRADARNFHILDKVREIAAARGKTCSQVAINWLCCQPHVTAAVIGARTQEQACDNLGSVGWWLSAEEVRQLDEVSGVPPGYPYDFINRLARKPAHALTSA